MKKRERTRALCYAIIPTVAVLLAGCGTTSDLRPSQGSNLKSMQKYSRVSVLDFADKTNGKSPGDKMREQGRHFSDLIALELNRTKAFEAVERADAPRAGSLTVSGDITKCVEGNAALRAWIGFGAGSSYFDAIVRCSDADTGQPLGEIVVDKNSWVLGGGLAQGQTVQTFMEGAAKKVADQLSKAKAGVATTTR